MAMAPPAERNLTLVPPPSDKSSAPGAALSGLPPEADLSAKSVQRLKASIPTT